MPFVLIILCFKIGSTLFFFLSDPRPDPTLFRPYSDPIFSSRVDPSSNPGDGSCLRNEIYVIVFSKHCLIGYGIRAKTRLLTLTWSDM